MREDPSHSACVDAWLERASRDLTPALLLDLFDQALSALWNRAEATLGNITLTAIAVRVIHDAKGKFPLLSSLTLESNGGIHLQQLRDQSPELDYAVLKEALRYVICQLLTVLGNLTAEILTPELHAELAKVEIESTRK